MSEAVDDTSKEDGQDHEQRYSFKTDAVIGGSLFTVEGEAPNSPGHFALMVSIPNDIWAKLKPKVAEARSTNPAFDARYSRLRLSYELGEGRVGIAWVNEATTGDDVPAIGLASIQTDSAYLPEGSEYHDASGVGSFILDSLCAIADIRGWRIYLEPRDRGGKLRDDQLVSWYERHGFEYSARHDKGGGSAFGSMVRLPGQVDAGQPIAQALARTF